MASLPETAMADDSQLHIAMVPWLAFGHMIPFLELAKLIAQKGHRISFVSTPRNIDRLPKLPADLAHLIDFVMLPLPRVANLPENAEATIDLPDDKVPYLKKAFDHMQEAMAQFLESSAPDWLFYDFIPYWLGPIAAKYNIASAYYSAYTASALAFLGPTSVLYGDDYRKEPNDFTVPPKWVPFPSTVAYRLFEFMRTNDSFSGDDTGGVTDMYRFGASIEACDMVAVRSSVEFEPEWLRLLEELYQKPVIPVGQLPPTPYIGGDVDTDSSWTVMKGWLDKQAKGSVVYVSLGTEAILTQEQLTEIALGLELSGLPFFWVHRKQRGFTDADKPVELPEGFEERTKGRGVLWRSWAPQLKILSHDSVGGYLIHSGWSSVVEAIVFEKALILLTFVSDQGLNARVLEAKKMGYPIPRDERDGSFTREAVAESLRLVMMEEEGKIYRDKVKEMNGLFGDRDRQNMYVDSLLSYLRSHRKMKKNSNSKSD